MLTIIWHLWVFYVKSAPKSVFVVNVLLNSFLFIKGDKFRIMVVVMIIITPVCCCCS